MRCEEKKIFAFGEKCSKADCTDSNLYTELLVEAMTVFDLSERQLAEFLCIPSTKIKQYLVGVNTLHSVMRRVHYGWLSVKARKLSAR